MPRSQLKKYVGRVTNWNSSDQRYRWVATALLKIETRMKKVEIILNKSKSAT